MSSSVAPSSIGNLAGALDDLLGSFGVVRADKRSSAEDIVADELTRLDLDADVVEIRWGKLVLSASPVTAKLLGFQKDALLASLHEQVPGTVDDIAIRVRRR